MSISAADITRVRNLADVTATDYDDDAIEYSIALFPVRDADGIEPTEDDWVETYDLYRAAADVVELRAAKLATRYDTSADGANLARSQMQAQLAALAARLLSRARPRVVNPTLPEVDESDDND